MKINNIAVTLQGDPIAEEELEIYLSQLQSKQKFKIVSAAVTVQGEFVNIRYELERVPFERIRRITGYLVGSMSKWGDGKRAEEKDRLKHN